MVIEGGSELLTAILSDSHDEYIERNRRCFEDDVPDDFEPYAYTYYDGNGYPSYHGFTTNARQRALVHRKKHRGHRGSSRCATAGALPRNRRGGWSGDSRTRCPRSAITNGEPGATMAGTGPGSIVNTRSTM